MPTYLYDSKGRIIEDPEWDPRNLLSKLRRKELEAILKDNDIPHQPNPPAYVSRELIKANDIRAERYIDEIGNFLWPVQKEPENPRTDGLKRPELIRMCKDLGIEWSMKDTKADLQQKVAAHAG